MSGPVLCSTLGTGQISGSENDLFFFFLLRLERMLYLCCLKNNDKRNTLVLQRFIRTNTNKSSRQNPSKVQTLEK